MLIVFQRLIQYREKRVLQKFQRDPQKLNHECFQYHLELSRQKMDLPEPSTNLGIGSGSHGERIGKMVEQLEKCFKERSPDIALVYGDTNSILAAVLAATRLMIEGQDLPSQIQKSRRCSKNEKADPLRGPALFPIPIVRAE